MHNTVVHVGSTTLTRVSYIDISVPSEVMGLDPVQYAEVEWRNPLWVDGEQVKVGGSIWFADTADGRIAFDPVQAADAVLRADPETEMAQQHAIAQCCADAGFPRESVDSLVMTHIEGVGMAAWRDEQRTWSRFFPNARIVVSEVGLAQFLSSDAALVGSLAFEAWRCLVDAGVVDTFTDQQQLAPGVRAEVTGAHCAGHAALHFAGDDPETAPAATFLGHLTISPLHLATGECPQPPIDPADAWAVLHACSYDGSFLIGPLWPSPGCGWWRNEEFVAFA